MLVYDTCRLCMLVYGTCWLCMLVYAAHVLQEQEKLVNPLIYLALKNVCGCFC